MILADTHLLGWSQGHWFDKIRREWQMERSFKSASLLFSPDAVFILGDIFDEGKWANDKEFNEHVQRFRKMFPHSTDTEMQVLVGNHDVGFHYMMSDHKLKRFEDSFKADMVRMVNLDGSLFILVNSMALEGDGCKLCMTARIKLKKIARQLQCSKNPKDPSLKCDGVEAIPYSRPILMQHFPLFRDSDEECSGLDAAPEDEKTIKFKPQIDALSREATQELFQWFEPRLVITAHTHHGCFTLHKFKKSSIPEWTVPSFSWRNRKNPSFLLMVSTPTNYAINKCFLPDENTAIYIYASGLILIFCWFISPVILRCKLSRYRKES
ncbi:metallophosphoesterase 1-like isoform X2 [Lineus longissimus]